jgi:hypothetical protein
MSIPLLAFVLAVQAQEVVDPLLLALQAQEAVDRSQEYRRDQRPYKYYQAMEPVWTAGRIAAVAGPPLALAGYFVSQGASNRNPTVDTGGESAGYYMGIVGFDLALAAPPIMLFGSMSALPALKKTGLHAKPTMGLVSAGLWLASVGLYGATLSSFDADPENTQWKALGVGGTVAWLGSAFFANSQINATKRAGDLQMGRR